MIYKLVLCIAVIVILWARRIRKKNISQSIKVGQPPSVPILGHALHLTPDKLIDSAEAFHSKYGGVVELYALSQRIYLISDLELIKEVLSKRPKVFRRVRSFDYGAKLLNLSSGLFNIHGANEWSRIRKLTSPSLAKHNIVGNVKNALHWSIVLKDRLLDAGKATNNVVDMKEHAFSYTVHVLIDAVFGRAKLNQEMQDYFFQVDFIKDIFTNFTFMIESSTFPFPKWLWHLIPYYENIERRAIAADERLTRFSRQIINERRAELTANPEEKLRTNVIDILLQTEKDGPGLSSVNGRESITEDEIVANVKTFFAGGSDTTSNTIAWVMYYLGIHKDIQSEVRSEVTKLFEIVQTFQEKSDDELFEAFSAESLPLTNAVIKEAIRLVSPAPMLFLQLESTTEAYTLSNGLVLQPEDQVFTGLDNVHWNNDTFPQAKSFQPHRWLTTDQELLKRYEASFVAFGGGPRVCPGWGFAVMESVVAVSTLVYHLDVELACEPGDVKRVFAFAAQPDKVPIRLKKRAL